MPGGIYPSTLYLFRLAGLACERDAIRVQRGKGARGLRKRMDTISYITDKIKEKFDAEGIEIPYPKRDIFITQKSD